MAGFRLHGLAQLPFDFAATRVYPYEKGLSLGSSEVVKVQVFEKFGVDECLC